jgi:acylphosphatase
MPGGARADAMIAWQVIVRGRVQGVGYRYTMVEAATALGVAGWVRNRRDGTVEALVQGDADAVESLVAWCRHGPPAACVTAVSTSVREWDPAIDAFECRRTE